MFACSRIVEGNATKQFWEQLCVQICAAQIPKFVAYPSLSPALKLFRPQLHIAGCKKMPDPSRIPYMENVV